MNRSTDILFLVPVTPAESGNGLAMRARVFLEGLARSHAVHVLVVPVFGGAQPPGALAQGLAASFDVLPLDPSAGGAADLARRLATPAGRRRAHALHPRPSLCRSVTLAAAERVAFLAEKSQLVHVMRLYLAPLLDALLERASRPALVLDVDDVESVTHGSLGLSEEAARFERLEAYYLPLLDHVVTCSEDDRRLLVRHHRLRAVTAVPNAVEPPAVPDKPEGRYDLLFVGSLGYQPNVDAARWLCRDVLPLLGDATVALVGAGPTARVLELAADPRVTVAADVAAVGPWYAGSRVAVAPLFSGGGTRIKVLEALAHRRPVVATSVGAAGLGVSGPHGPVLVADTPEEFASACSLLLGDCALASRMATRGMEIVAGRYTVEVVAGSIDSLASHILSP